MPEPPHGGDVLSAGVLSPRLRDAIHEGIWPFIGKADRVGQIWKSTLSHFRLAKKSALTSSRA